MPADREQAILELVMGWLRQAHSDLSVAQMVENEEISPEILAFHAQQAVEKSLKALLVKHQVEFPRTHIIGVLIKLCEEAGYPINDVLKESVTLSRFAVATRYPGEVDPARREEAQVAAELDRQVVAWVESQLA